MKTWNLPSIDILGYGPIHEDLDAGRLGLVWGKAKAFADSPEKVTARTEEQATSMSVTMNVLDLVKDSKEEVMLVSPYFVPGRKGVQTFDDLRRRNVKVTILTNSLASNDEPIVHTGYARYRMALLKSGVDIYEISPSRLVKNERLMLPGMSQGRLHAKTAVIDKNLVFIGSMNLDPRSSSKNTELGVIAESPQLAKEVLRALHISKLQSTYRVRLAQDGRTIEWLTMDDKGEMVLTTEPDTSFFSRFKHWLLSPFVPEDQL
jgi:putative cardiolipin synthase